jgi:natural product precursor
MESKKINLNTLKKVLSQKELKNILGGSGNCRTICEAGCTYYCCFDGTSWICDDLGCITK